MVYNPTDKGESSQDLVWDLRQYNAQIIGSHWLRIPPLRGDLPKYFEALIDFHTVLEHDVKQNRLEEFNETWERMINEFLKMIQTNEQVYLGKVYKPQVRWNLQKKLREIERFLSMEVTLSGIKGLKEKREIGL